MRLQPDDPFYLFNEKDGEWKIENGTKTCVQKSEKMPFVGLAFSPLLKQERMRFMFEKATELGVSDFFPVKMEYTQGKINEKKALHWIVEASEQCERIQIPTIHPIVSFEAFLKKEDLNICVALERNEKSDPYQKNHNNCVLIGPEGGFSPVEKNLLITKKLPTLSLGKYILRAETASIIALNKLI